MSVPNITTANNDIKSLYRLVSIAAGSSRAMAVERNSFIINEVSPALNVATDENILANVLRQLLDSVITTTNDGCIRIAAKEYDDVVFVSIKDSSSYGPLSVESNLDQLKSLARTMNGNISITESDNKFNAITLSFPNFPSVNN